MGVIFLGGQVEYGKAFEYACIKSLSRVLKEEQQVYTVSNSAIEVASKFYENFDPEIQSRLDKAADAATRVLLNMEPMLLYKDTDKPLVLKIQEDAKGKEGDVRDIVASREGSEWEIGISCKHNHAAVKHSRLSDKIDFGKVWFSIPCSQIYFNEIRPIFEELRELKLKGMNWNDIDKKEERYYKPILNSFIDELRRLETSNPGVIPERLLKYLLGRNDFYKVIADDSQRATVVQAFSMEGMLNKSAGKTKSLHVPQVNMPSKIYDISFKEGSNTTINIVYDKGWSISMRIHNASSKVEPSLKFDIGLVGVPQALASVIEHWNK